MQESGNATNKLQCMQTVSHSR